ncbi:MAG: transketolase [Bacteroidia bacterium]|nr:transketolase [Bacteroidia bacterium]
MKVAESDFGALASQVRRDIIRMVHGAKSGHPGGSLGCTEYFVLLYFKYLKHNPDAFTLDGIGEDIFFLSNGHISPVWYSTLARSGYFSITELSTFRKLGTRLQGHPATHEKLPGIRVASGSLGQGLSVAIGAALAKKINHDPNRVFALLGDGELNEGQIWEAILFAAHHQIDNIFVTVDWNGQQVDGTTQDVMNMGNLQAKWESFGWKVVTCPNGNDFSILNESFQTVLGAMNQQKPVVLLMQTTMGKGVDFMEGTHKWHGQPPKDAEAARALEQLPETFGDY